MRSAESTVQKAKDWAGFKEAIDRLEPKAKGDAFELLTRLYLQLEPKYATKLADVWHLRDVPAKVRAHLNLPDTDEGIDLVAQTKTGEYWAIQCKYRSDESTSLTRRKLSTFTDLAFGVCRHFELALVCTTADRFSRKLKLHGDKVSFCAGDVWRALDTEFFDRVRGLLSDKKPELIPLRPRPHQERAIQNAIEHFEVEGNTRGKMIMPCGTGKSLTAYWIADRLPAKKILVAVPSLALVRQTLAVWARESLAAGHDFEWICVCSDESVADVNGYDTGVLVQDLGVRIHTDPDEIAEWFSKATTNTTVVFSTYQSAKAVSEAARKADVTFDLGIMDEAHKTVGKRDALFSHFLHDENVPIVRRVFMTATERHYRGRSDKMVSMDDPEIYGESFEVLSFKEALECDPAILCDYRILTVAVSDAEIAGLIDRNVLVRPDKGKWDQEVEAEMLASVVALRKAMQDYPIRHAVSFHSSIARARSFRDTNQKLSDSFREFDSIETFHVSGKTPTAARARVMDTFAESARALITNARCLTEGVDVPDIDCVLFADPKRSTIDIVQSVGRALRRTDGKGFGYVIIPILIDSDAEEIDVTVDSAFGTLLTTLRALAANDERIVEYFRSVSEGRRPSRGEGRFELIVPDGIVIDAAWFVDSIENKLWSRLGKLSWRPFEEAREFVRSLGLRNAREWFAYRRGDLPEKGVMPADIPTAPNLVYSGEGWVSFNDWFGSDTRSNWGREYRDFESARDFARSLGLKSRSEWVRFCQGKIPKLGTRPDDIPADPVKVYTGRGWKGVGDWLGTGVIQTSQREFRSYREARRFARSLGLRNVQDWRSYCRGEHPDKEELPKDLPTTPERTYAGNGWGGYGDWLGTGVVASQNLVFRPFTDARNFVRGLNLKSSTDWGAYCKGELPGFDPKPDDIPQKPYRTYSDEWISWGDFLGTGTVATTKRSFRDFESARTFARGLGLMSKAEWSRYSKGEMPEVGLRPKDIPSAPRRTYLHSGWVSWPDWLGTADVG